MKTKTKHKQNRYRKLHKTKRAGAKKISLLFSNNLNANVLTNNKEVKIEPVSNKTKLKAVINSINKQLVEQFNVDPIDITYLQKSHSNKRLDIHKTLAQLGLKNNDTLFYISNKDSEIISVKRTILNKDCLKRLGLSIYVKITFTFNTGLPVNIYLATAKGQKKKPFYPLPHLIIFTEEDIEKANFCRGSTISSFKANKLFRLLPGIRRNVNPQFNYYEGETPIHFSSITQEDTPEAVLKNWIQNVEQKIYKQHNHKETDFGDFVEGRGRQCYVFVENTIHPIKVSSILRDIVNLVQA